MAGGVELLRGGGAIITQLCFVIGWQSWETEVPKASEQAASAAEDRFGSGRGYRANANYEHTLPWSVGGGTFSRGKSLKFAGWALLVNTGMTPAQQSDTQRELHFCQCLSPQARSSGVERSSRDGHAGCRPNCEHARCR